MITHPPAQACPRIFYGWYVVGISVLGGVLGCGMSQLFMGLMLKPMTEDFGWSRTAASGAVTAGTFAAALSAPILGRLADRYGSRPIVTLAALVVGAGYFGLATMSDLWQFYALFILSRGVSAMSFAGVVPMAAMANWFRRMRGRVMGIVGMASPLGTSVLAFVAQLIIEEHGWRAVFQVFALAMLALLFPLAALFLRRRPEDLGLFPDGDLVPTTAERSTTTKPGDLQPEGEEFGWTLGEAVRTPALWLLIAGLTAAIMGEGAVGFHQVAYYTDVGIPATAAALALTVYALSGSLGNGLWGFLVERFNERYLAVAVMLLGALFVAFLLFVRNTAGAMVFSVLFGLAGRGEVSLGRMIVAQYFGRTSYGAILGIVTPFTLVGLGIGPMIAAAAFDATGSYQGVFVFCSGLFLLAALLLWLARKPLPPGQLRKSRVEAAIPRI